MPLNSSTDHYGNVAITIHWVTAIAVILMLASGQVMDWVGEPAVVAILPWHLAIGMVIGVLTLLRILWWVAFDRRPAPIGGMPRWQERTASVVHYGLYAAILVLFVSGIVMIVQANALGPIYFGGTLPSLSQTPQRLAHGLASRIILLLAVIHIGAALYHQFIKRDRLLVRMGLGR
ncbi:MAG: cytochrome b [Devosia sp.]|nr:cytochrome b [Devosia sp.]